MSKQLYASRREALAEVFRLMWNFGAPEKKAPDAWAVDIAERMPFTVGLVEEVLEILRGDKLAAVDVLELSAALAACPVAMAEAVARLRKHGAEWRRPVFEL